MLDFTLDVISLIREYFVSDKRRLLLAAAGLRAKSRPGLVPAWRVSLCRLRGLILGFVPG